MADDHFEWRRFWCPIKDKFTLGEDGYLPNPYDENGQHFNPSLVQYDSIHDRPCIVFLGEPGIGKTQAVVDANAWTERTKTPTKYIDLGNYGDESRLISEIFETVDFVDGLKCGPYLLFLDSLDECQLQIQHVARILASELLKRKATLANLRLRIACRDLDWPANLQAALKDFYGKEPEIFQLAPLRRIDVEIASRELSNPDAFMQEIERLKAQPLAIKPITLLFLLSTFGSSQKLSETREELYEVGCLKLLSEANPNRIAARQKGPLSPSIRLEIASRIAAISMFCGVSSIVMDAEREPVSWDLICKPVEAFIGGEEASNGIVQLVSEEAVEEVLGTPLFRKRDGGAMGFAHQSYAEYLAARYLKKKGVRPQLKQDLLLQPEFGRRLAYPQVREVAIWLAAIDTEFFEVLFEDDPIAILQSDTIQLSDEQKEKLLARLFALFETEQINEPHWDDWKHYQRLAHPGVALQLSNMLGSAKAESTKIFLLHVVRVASLTEHIDQLVVMALEPASIGQVRYVTIDALTAIAEAEKLSLLKPLVALKASTDIEFATKERLLMALWPNLLNAEELFGALLETQLSRHGRYQSFIKFEICKHLKDEDFAVALRWATSFDDETPRIAPFNSFIGKIARQAFDHYENAIVRDSLIQFSIHRMSRHLPIFGSARRDEPQPPITAESPNRRDFVGRLVAVALNSNYLPFALSESDCPLIFSTDFEWLIAKAKSEKDPARARRWSSLARRVYDQTIPAHFELAVTSYRDTPELIEEFGILFDPVPLGSREASSQRKGYEKYELRRREQEGNSADACKKLSLEEAIEKALALCETELMKYWGTLIDLIQLKPEDKNGRIEYGGDITTFPGWQSADFERKSRIIRFANSIALDGEYAADAVDLTNDSFRFSAIYGFQALALLAKESHVDFLRLTADQWKSWAPTVIWMQDDGSTHDDPVTEVVLSRCVEFAREHCIECIRQLLTGQNQRRERYIRDKAMERLWCNEVHAIAISFLLAQSTCTEVFEGLLEICLRQKSFEAKCIAIEMVQSEALEPSESRTHSVSAATQLILHTEDAAWDVVWPKFQSDVAFGKAVIGKVADAGRMNPTIVFKISQMDAAKLFVWIVEHYGFEPAWEEFKDSGRPPDGTPEYRDSMLRAMEQRGSTEGVEAMRFVSARFPDQAWLHRMVNSTIEKAVRNAWLPIEPMEFLSLIQRENYRLVKNAGQLQDLILESLERLQQKLQGENPAVEDLWNADEPKVENCFSDYVVRHLRDDLNGRGLVASREVQIRRGASGTQGENVDIYVTCQVVDPNSKTIESVLVIIEVKCIWHPDWKTAMKDQLVDRYLSNGSCRHGIYLFGWYDAPRWNIRKNSYKASRKISFADAADLLRLQEEFLTTVGTGRQIRSFVMDCGFTLRAERP